MAPDPAAADRAERGRAWRRRAAEALGPIGADRVATRASSVPWDDRLVVDAWAVRAAERCLASLGGTAPEFVESATTARRRLALAVLGVLADDPRLTPVDAARRVLDDPDGLPWGLREWFDGLGEGGTAAAVGAALAHVGALLDWLHPSSLTAVRVARPSDRLEWRLPGTTVFVRGRVDATHGPANPAERVLLVVLGGGWDRHVVDVEVGHAALAWTLNSGAMPARVSWVHLPTGHDGRVAPDDDVLAAALDRVGGALAARVAARFGPDAATSPGSWCRWCDRRDGCAPGQAWLAAAPRRVGGLPLRA